MHQRHADVTVRGSLPRPERRVLELLERVRDDATHPDIEDELTALSVARIADLDEDEKRAFWLNAYNVAVQHLLAVRSDSPSDAGFFDATVGVGETTLSLNDIEHGVLRRRRPSGLAYDPVASRRVLTRLEVERLDPRIHFALNCGARSCPTIVPYESPQLDDRLDDATERYLAAEADYEDGTVVVPELFEWFEADFGGPDGVVEFLRTYGPVPEDVTPGVEYRDWDWRTIPRKFR